MPIITMFKKFLRYAIGFVLLAAIIASFILNKVFLFCVSVFFIIIAMVEYRNMFKNMNIHPHKFLPELIGSISAYTFTFSSEAIEQSIIFPLIILGTILSFSITIVFNKKPYLETSLSTISAILMIMCGLYIIKLTYYFEDNTSALLVLIYFTAVLCADFTASKIGPLYKKIKLAPDISPNKTLLGAVIHVISSCITCCFLEFYINISLWQCILLGFFISVFAQLGDLTVSLFKRSLGLKHSGNFFYNYGGVLDRMDAFIFSAPAAYYFLYYISYSAIF